MDPEESLKRQLEYARRIQESWENCKNPDQLPMLALGLAQEVLQLDKWIQEGGYLPKPWSRGRRVLGHQKEYASQMRCFDCGGAREQYALKRDVWEEAWPDYRQEKTRRFREFGRDHPGQHLDLCFNCVERRLGRVLVPEDFLNVPINDPLPKRYRR